MTEEKTTTIKISKKNQKRLSSILKYGESADFGVSLLLLNFAKPKFGAGGAFESGRTVYPLFTEEEIGHIRKELREHATSEPLMTPKQIQSEIEKETEEEKFKKE